MDEERTSELLEESGEPDFWAEADTDESGADIDVQDNGETAESESEDTAEAADADQQEREAPEEPAKEQAEADAGNEADQSFTLKHLDEVRTVGRDEVIALAQKGLDYDRIRVDYDEFSRMRGEIADAAEAKEFLAGLAKENGLSVREFIDSTNASVLARKEGIDVSVAAERIRLQRREKELAEREAQLKSSADRQDAEAEKQRLAKEKRDADIKEFLEAHKDSPIDVKTIPQSVWTDVAKGMTLTAAYMKYENQQLRAQLQAKEAEAKIKAQSTKNASRSTGSRATDSNTERDRSDWWYEEDE